MVNNQAWINSNFRDKREIKLIGENFQDQLLIDSYLRLEEIYLYQVKSIKKVALRNLVELKECTIWNCGLTELVIEDCPLINKLNVRNNLLTSLEFLNGLSNLKELELDISCNNFLRSDLEPFSRITKMRRLNVGNLLSKKAFLGKYNRFHDSLVHLRNMNRLEELDISNTDIDRGLEQLPTGLGKITCSSDSIIALAKGIRGNKCSEIIQELKGYQISSNCYSLTDWRRVRQTSRNEKDNKEEISQENNHLRGQLNRVEELIANVQVSSRNNR